MLLLLPVLINNGPRLASEFERRSEPELRVPDGGILVVYFIGKNNHPR